MVILIQVDDYSHRNLLAIPVGIKQKDSVDAIVEKVSNTFFCCYVQSDIK